MPFIEENKNVEDIDTANKHRMSRDKSTLKWRGRGRDDTNRFVNWQTAPLRTKRFNFRRILGSDRVDLSTYNHRFDPNRGREGSVLMRGSDKVTTRMHPLSDGKSSLDFMKKWVVMLITNECLGKKMIIANTIRNHQKLVFWWDGMLLKNVKLFLQVKINENRRRTNFSPLAIN